MNISVKTVPLGNDDPPPPIIAAVLGTGTLTATSKCPVERNAVASASIKPFSLAGPRRCTPNWNPPTTRVVARLSSTFSFPSAFRSSARICSPRTAPSPSMPYEETITRWPMNLRHTSPINLCWSRLRLRGETIASSRNRSSRSASAIERAISARASASFARASEVVICASYFFANASASRDRSVAFFASAFDAAIAESNPLAVDCAIAARSSALAASVRDAVIRASSNSTTTSLAREPKYSAKPSPAIPKTATINPSFLVLDIHAGGTKRATATPVLGCIRNLTGIWSAISSRTTPANRSTVHHISALSHQLESATKAIRVRSSNALTIAARDGTAGGRAGVIIERQTKLDDVAPAGLPSVLILSAILTLIRHN
jgi:hypothetical protein